MGFNPRPPRRMGAIIHRETTTHKRRVSILAHPEGWALYAGTLDRKGVNHSFNPRPPRRMGAMYTASTFVRLYSVSILAHPEGWALSGGLIYYLGQKKFQSSPTPKDGRYRCAMMIFVLMAGFNPRPPRRMGAMRQFRLKAHRSYSFNPRPPRRMGAIRVDSPRLR